MSAIHGRQDDVFAYPNGRRVHPHTFRSLLTRHAGVAEYQVQQTDRGARVIVVGSEAVDLGTLTRELEKALFEAGLDRAEVRVQRVRSIERHPQSQKLKRFVPMA
jgi:phenylacetate-coenzyme A ligase PaaK-like adenylate-forming protein